MTKKYDLTSEDVKRFRELLDRYAAAQAAAVERDNARADLRAALHGAAPELLDAWEERALRIEREADLEETLARACAERDRLRAELDEKKRRMSVFRDTYLEWLKTPNLLPSDDLLNAIAGLLEDEDLRIKI